jgi:beta-N-acetylhexosaminidase|tara:strand:+ start:780 stop:1826 length:1047 start_codon:yes stop_codon:yes gene_type:complete
MNSNKIKTMIGQMIIIGIRATNDLDVKRFFQNHKGIYAGGIILYDQNVTTKPWSSHNIINPEQLKELNKSLQSYSKTPLFIGIDQEGGNVNRLSSSYGFPNFKSWGELGRINDLKITTEQSFLMAETLSKCGVNLNFAPVLDLMINKSSFIASEDRCFSDNPEKLIKHAKIFIELHLKNNVISVCKHFPGQGSASGDSHEGLVDVTDTWKKSELTPYKSLIKADSIKAIMTSHLIHKKLDNNLPATLSTKVLKDLLRSEMGFNGVIISDDPSMDAISKNYNLKETLLLMINAGVDIFCFGNNLHYDENLLKKVFNILLELYEEKQISENQIYTSYKRIMTLKKSIGII